MTTIGFMAKRRRKVLMSTIGKILFVAIIVLLIVIGIIVFKCVKKSNDYF